MWVTTKRLNACKCIISNVLQKEEKLNQCIGTQLYVHTIKLLHRSQDTVPLNFLCAASYCTMKS